MSTLSERGSLQKQVKKPAMVDLVCVPLNESSIDMSSKCERCPVSSVAHCLKVLLPEPLPQRAVWLVFRSDVLCMPKKVQNLEARTKNRE